MTSYNMTAETLAAETRRPVLVAWAKQNGVSTEGETVVSLRKKLLSVSNESKKGTNTMATPKTTPQKPGAPQKPSAPAAAPQKPGAPGAPQKPAAPAPQKPAAPAAVVPQKPGAPQKPAAPAPQKPTTPGAPPPAVPDDGKLKAEVEALSKQVTALSTTLTELSARFDALDKQVKEQDGFLAKLRDAAFGDGEFDAETGTVVLNIEGASRQQLLNWYYQFGLELPEGAATEDMRAGLLAMREQEGFEGFEYVNDLEGDAPDPGVSAPQEAAFEKEEVVKANWSRLTEMADQLGVDYSDIKGPPPQPKVLRNRVLQALETQAAPAAEASDSGWVEGAKVSVNVEGESYPGVYVGPGETEGTVVVRFEEPDDDGNTDFELPAEQVSLA